MRDVPYFSMLMPVALSLDSSPPQGMSQEPETILCGGPTSADVPGRTNVLLPSAPSNTHSAGPTKIEETLRGFAVLHVRSSATMAGRWCEQVDDEETWMAKGELGWGWGLLIGVDCKIPLSTRKSTV